MSEVMQLGGFGVGARDDQRRRAHHVGGEPRGVEVADVRGGRDQHLAAEMAALLLRRELVLVVDAGGTCLDEGLHDLEGVERPAEAGLGIGDDGREPGVDRQPVAFRGLDLVGALQRAVDALAQLGRGVGRIERLVGIHRRRRVGVGRDLPAREIDRLEAGPHHLHGLVAAERAERVDEVLLVDQLPQPVGAHFGERVPDLDRAAQPLDVGRRIGPLDIVEAAFRRRGNQVVKISHVALQIASAIHCWRRSML